MRFQHITAVLLSALCIGTLAFGEEDDSDFLKLQGTWKGTSPEGASLNVSIDGTTLTSNVKMKSSVRGRGGSYTVEQEILVDETSSPKEIDFHTVDEKGDPKVIMGIYKIKGDKFTICTDPTGKRRPTKFDGTKEGGSMVVYNRYPSTQNRTAAQNKSGKSIPPRSITVKSNTR